MGRNWIRRLIVRAPVEANNHAGSWGAPGSFRAITIARVEGRHERPDRERPGASKRTRSCGGGRAITALVTLATRDGGTDPLPRRVRRDGRGDLSLACPGVGRLIS